MMCVTKQCAQVFFSSHFSLPLVTHFVMICGVFQNATKGSSSLFILTQCYWFNLDYIKLTCMFFLIYSKYLPLFDDACCHSYGRTLPTPRSVVGILGHSPRLVFRLFLQQLAILLHINLTSAAALPPDDQNLSVLV